MRVEWTDVCFLGLVALITIKVGVPTYTDWRIAQDEAQVENRLMNLSSDIISHKQERVYLEHNGDQRIGILRLPGTIEIGFGLIESTYVNGEIVEVDDDRRLIVVRGK